MRSVRDWGLTAALLVAIAAIGIVDVLTGPEYGFALFYLVPISLGAWYVGARGGVVLAVAATISWFLADLLDRTPDTVLASVWNGATRGVIFVGVALLLAVLRAREAQARELDLFRGEVLELIDRQVPERLDRVRRLAAAGGRGTRDAGLDAAIDDLVLLTNSVIALSLVASGAASHADPGAVVDESIRALADRDRVVRGSVPTTRVAFDGRVLRFLLSGVLVAAVRSTDAYVRVMGRADGTFVRVRVEIDAATRATAARPVADLLVAIATARTVLERKGGTVSVHELDKATGVELALPVA